MAKLHWVVCLDNLPEAPAAVTTGGTRVVSSEDEEVLVGQQWVGRIINGGGVQEEDDTSLSGSRGRQDEGNMFLALDFCATLLRGEIRLWRWKRAAGQARASRRPVGQRLAFGKAWRASCLGPAASFSSCNLDVHSQLRLYQTEPSTTASCQFDAQGTHSESIPPIELIERSLTLSRVGNDPSKPSLGQINHSAYLTMPPALHPRSRMTLSLFTSTLAISFLVVGLPHVIPCPADLNKRVYADGEMPGIPAGARRRRKRRLTDEEKDSAMSLDQYEKSAAVRLDEKERECPVPKPSGLVGQLLGFDKTVKTTPAVVKIESFAERAHRQSSTGGDS
jgi:cytochrome c oxidase assembly factor 2